MLPAPEVRRRDDREEIAGQERRERGQNGAGRARLTLAALRDPHPALAAAVPFNPVVDAWKADDWFHWGAFRPAYAFDFIYSMETRKGAFTGYPYEARDRYRWLLDQGASAKARLFAETTPQTFVPSIMTAAPELYRSQRHRVHHCAAHATHLELPVDAATR